MKLLKSLSFILMLLLACSSNFTPEYFLQVDAKKVLRHVLHHQKGWVKIHAAEYLIDLNLQHGIDSIFWLEHQQLKDDASYRTGIWRVLNQVHRNKEDWASRIVDVARDTGSIDQIYAIESLARLKENHHSLSEELKVHILKSDHSRLKAYTQWLLAVPLNKFGQPVIDPLQMMLNWEEEEVKSIAAIALRDLQYFPEQDWNQLYQLAMDEPSRSNAKVFLISAAMTLSPDLNSSEFKQLEKVLLSYKNSQNKSKRFVLCETLAEVGHAGHFRLLGDLVYMNNPIINLETIESPQEHPVNIDVSAAASYAVLKIRERLDNSY